jgi:hypothetical protein
LPKLLLPLLSGLPPDIAIDATPPTTITSPATQATFATPRRR